MNFLKFVILPWIISWFYRLLYMSYRVRVVNPPDFSKPVLFAHWHGEELALMGYFNFRNWVVMVSHSKDGELLSRTMKHLGWRVVRGSSSKGAASGFLGLVKTIKRESTSGSLAVDGPRGPLHEVKPGVIKLASITGLPLYPARITHVSRKKVFHRSWNKAILPKPFAKIEITFGEPLSIPPKIEDEQLELNRQILQDRLHTH